MPGLFSIGACLFDRDRRTLSRGGRTLALSPKEAEALAYLSSHAGRLVPRAELEQEVWQLNPRVRTQTVAVCLRRLRAKLDELSAGECLRTVRSAGWVLEPGDAKGPTGRAAESSALEAALARPGLVSLVGIGGIGKTHLARAVAGDAPWVDLGEAHGAEVMAAVAAALGVWIGPGGDPAHRVASALRSHRLVVLDDAATDPETTALLGLWLAAAPDLALLRTGPGPVGIDGERVVVLGPLDPAAAASLFAERAPAAAGDPGVPELLELLAGIPLGIELAAGRTRVMGVDAVIARMGRSDLLRDPSRPEGRQSLAETLTRSLRSLDPSDLEALVGCATLAGTFDLDAAEAMVSLDALASLVDGGLVRRDGDGYRVLDPIRAAAHEVGARWRDRSFGRHVELMVDRARATLGSLTHPHLGADLPPWFARDRANLLLALRRAEALENADAVVSVGLAVIHGCRIVGPAEVLDATFARLRPWLSRAERTLRMAVRDREAERLKGLGRPSEAARAWEAARAEAETPTEAAELDQWRANLYRAEGDLDTAERLLGSALAVLERGGPSLPLGDSLASLGMVLLARGRHDEATGLHRRAAEVYHAVGDARREGAEYANLGLILHQQGRVDEADALLQQAGELLTVGGDRWLLLKLEHSRARLGLQAGRYEGLGERLAAVAAEAQALGDPVLQGQVASDRAELAGFRGDGPEADRLFQESLSLLRLANPFLATQGLAVRALWRWVEGRPTEALALFEEARCHEVLQRHGAILELVDTLRAGVLAELRDADGADRALPSSRTTEVARMVEALIGIARASTDPARRAEAWAAAERCLIHNQRPGEGGRAPSERSTVVRAVDLVVRRILAEQVPARYGAGPPAARK